MVGILGNAALAANSAAEAALTNKLLKGKGSFREGYDDFKRRRVLGSEVANHLLVKEGVVRKGTKKILAQEYHSSETRQFYLYKTGW